MTASVVSSNDAIDAACCRAEGTTLAGSITPACTGFSYVSVCPLNDYDTLKRRGRDAHRSLTRAAATEGGVIAFPEVGGLHHRYERRAA